VKFDFEKWKYCIDEIMDKLGIFKASFTGGEPSLEFDNLVKCLEYLKSKDENIFTIINTNGSNLDKLIGLDCLDNIALSRHSIDDLENQKIFGATVIPNLEQIKEFPEKEKLHLSCNIVKGYVDSDEKIKEYLEKCSEIGVRDVGFVSLMPINDYAKEHNIDFSDIKFEFNNRFIVNQYFDRIKDNKCVCKCRNYMYLGQNGQVVTAYSRYYVDNTCSDGAVVFMDNNLRQGFTGEIII
jgi:MoaA/NifB/PqqE/SkfB family radical SAM enzyme